MHFLRDHVGELELRIEAPTLADLFAEAARALAEIVAGKLDGSAADEEEWVEIRAADAEALLVDWLNELVFRGETRGRAYPVIHVESADARELRARVRGVAIEEIHTAVKAATFHGLQVEKLGSGYGATVIFDI